MKLGLIFPGQGSQYVGMGRDFLLKFPELNEFLECADDILGFSLSRVMLQGPDSELVETLCSQTAIYVHSCMILKKIETLFPSLDINLVAGLSLGEYTALTAAKKVAFADVLPVIKCRGLLMNQACRDHPGGMSAILGLKAEEVEDVLREHENTEIWIANYNSPNQTVISGSVKDIEKITEEFRRCGARKVVKLNVFGAFHSPYMRFPENNVLEEMITNLPIHETKTDIVMNVSAQPVHDPLIIKENLVKQVYSSVCWSRTVSLMDSEIDLFVEIGAGMTLKGLNKNNNVHKPTINIGKVQDLEMFENYMRDNHE